MIRAATPDDIPAMLALGKAMHDESPHYAPHPWDEEKVRGLLKFMIDSDDYLAIVVERDGELLGGLLAESYEFFFSRAKVSSDFVLFIAPGKRGGVAAAALVRGYIEWAKGKGVQSIQIGITTGVREEETAALSQACGFEPSGRIFEYRETA